MVILYQSLMNCDAHVRNHIRGGYARNRNHDGVHDCCHCKRNNIHCVGVRCVCDFRSTHDNDYVRCVHGNDDYVDVLHFLMTLLYLQIFTNVC